MSQLRTRLEAAKSTYASATYGGDLAADVLGAMPRSNPWRARVLWLAPAAVAAMMAVVMWPRHGGTPQRPSVEIGKSTVAIGPAPTMSVTRPTLEFQPLRVDMYVMEVRSGMEDAIGSLTNGVDTALQAPVVTESVQSVRHVAGELQDFAAVTWEQLKPRASRGS